ncbi:MAG: site-specific DNA-methyltransferase [Alphaproteobacteria bacterium]|nr:site-specific DNA-methyltransferase [Alphaproteobacteria bacterium]
MEEPSCLAQGECRPGIVLRLGAEGRYRTNVLDYPGGATPDATRQAELAMHPTVKPVSLIADLIRDCSERGGLVLDLFGGSGSALLAAERTGRRARLVELDPAYVDLTIRRWQQLTGRDAVLEGTGKTFNQIEQEKSDAEKA